MNKRNGLEIRAALLRRGKSLADVAVQAGVTRSLVSRTVNGMANNKRVLRTLLAMGVASKLLILPEDVKARENA